MTKKQVKIVYTFVQAMLIAFLFLPVGTISSGSGADSSLSVFGMVQHYAGKGFFYNALLYMVLACLLPVLSVVLLFVFKDRKNFGTVAFLSAFYTLAAACFFTAAEQKMVDSVSMTGLHYLIVLASLLSMFLAILGFFLAAPQTGQGEE